MTWEWGYYVVLRKCACIGACCAWECCVWCVCMFENVDWYYAGIYYVFKWLLVGVASWEIWKLLVRGTSCVLVSYPDPTRKIKKGHDTLSERNSISYSVTCNCLHRGDNWRCAQLAACSVLICMADFGFVLCLACGDEALSREWRVLNNTNGQLQWKVAMTKTLPVVSWQRMTTETEASAAFLCFSNNFSYSILPLAASGACQDATGLSACSRLMWRIWILQPDWHTLYSVHNHSNVLCVANPLLNFPSGVWVRDYFCTCITKLLKHCVQKNS